VRDSADRAETVQGVQEVVSSLIADQARCQGAAVQAPRQRTRGANLRGGVQE
jgi:hypothetical protein